MIGYSPFNFTMKHKPTIVTELVENGGLNSVLDLENQSRASSKWKNTKKVDNNLWNCTCNEILTSKRYHPF